MAQPHLQETFAKTWQMHKDGAPAAPGPVKELCKVLVHMGWSWNNPWHFGRPSRRQLGLFEGSEGWWLHEVRDGLRIAEWKIAAGRRADMIGMQSDHGVDKLAILALYNGSNSTSYEKGLLRSFLSGSCRTRDRLFKAGLSESPICQFCNHENETVDHFMWRCPAWDRLRLAAEIPVNAITNAWPPCTRECGIVLESSDLMDWVDQGPDTECRFCEDFVLPDSVHEEVSESTFEDGYRVVWTDGASCNNQDSRLRRAGRGVFFGVGNVSNISCSLPGREQSNQRSELYAVILAIRQCVDKLEIRSDSAYVVEGMNYYMSTGNLRGKGENGDLWRLLTLELDGRSHDDTRITWVKGHAKKFDVRRGGPTMKKPLQNNAGDV